MNWADRALLAALVVRFPAHCVAAAWTLRTRSCAGIAVLYADDAPTPTGVGRPPIDDVLAAVVVRMARENPRRDT